MIPFRNRLPAFLFALALTAPAIAQENAPAGGQQVVNAQSADIRAFIQEVSRVTGRTFVIDPGVQGQVAIASGAPLSDDEMYEVFLATLRAHGYVVLPTSSGALRITPDSQAATQPSGSGGERFVTQVIRLKSRDAATVLPVIQPLVGRGGQVSAAERANAIVVTDFADNVRRLTALVNDLDRDVDTIEIVGLKNSRPTALAVALREITGGSAGEKSFSAASFTAVDSSNSLVIRGPAETVARLRRVAETLDEQARPTGDTRVIFLQHADAETMVDLLQIVLEQPPRQQVQPGEGGATQAPIPAQMGQNQRGSIARYEGANAIIVRADPTVQQEVEAIVRELDKRAEQVLVQAIVVEISDGAAQNLGVQFLLSGDDSGTLPFFATSYASASPNLLALSAALTGGSSLPDDSPILEDLQGAALQSLLGANGAIGGFASDLDGDGLFGMILNAVKRDSGSNLLSTPSILTLNNHEANFLVGQEVPVTTGEVLSNNNSNPFRTIDRKDIGIKFRVRPQINADDSITMDISQEVSSIAAPLSATGGEFVFNKRNIETSVLVDNGEIVVLGGLLDQGERLALDKVPGLGDIPVLGRLFSSEDRESFETNLVIFIRPIVIGDAAAARRVTTPAIERMRQIKSGSDPRGVLSFDEILPPAPPPVGGQQ